MNRIKIPVEEMPWYNDLLDFCGYGGKYLEEVVSLIPIKDFFLVDQRSLFLLVEKSYKNKHNDRKIFHSELIARMILEKITWAIEDDLLSEFRPILEAAKKNGRGYIDDLRLKKKMQLKMRRFSQSLKKL